MKDAIETALSARHVPNEIFQGEGDFAVDRRLLRVVLIAITGFDVFLSKILGVSHMLVLHLTGAWMT
ncbi:MAG: hypothetical protein ABIX46_13615 [Burkholderiaceae bacterium]